MEAIAAIRIRAGLARRLGARNKQGRTVFDLTGRYCLALPIAGLLLNGPF